MDGEVSRSVFAAPTGCRPFPFVLPCGLIGYVGRLGLPVFVTCGDRETALGCAGLCGEAQPRIITARLMVSLPVHVSCFDLNIVYTNMSGVIPSPPFSRLVLELLGEYFSGYCDRRPPPRLPSIP